ncbi:3'-5' exonuclease [Paenibacillus larvae]|uniref:3'-5' exonuclease n=2 Tax=Paenibacillus larvae TaxID=1464 RepID=A0AAP5JV12_9BACL|nr:3'-5' exonuclease [Paenibacillus larvae]MDT2172929.1 3'-5' exonuclease [Paenibacillus larvae]MDT2193359.1 3'-5' exonuclease [Paenibacillus larvae]MDT2207903.1 3'-5' exonuclease [Paenibacillus larvae]MDT2230659.1 3'-5' exonuclease [Paenibacillus larvae]MDT2232907.1 3'-5' exonuclease [Paenibacillus larvae]
MREIYTVFDLETTGLDPTKDQITEIAAIRTDLIREYGRLDIRITKNSGTKLTPEIVNLTGISESMMRGGVPEPVAIMLLSCFMSGTIVVAHHAPFDLAFLARYQFEPDSFVCTRALSKLVESDESASLASVAERRGIELTGHHRAMNDVEATVKVFQQMKAEADALGIKYYNVLINDEERPLTYIPKLAKVIDKTKGEIVSRK